MRYLCAGCCRGFRLHQTTREPLSCGDFRYCSVECFDSHHGHASDYPHAADLSATRWVVAS